MAQDSLNNSKFIKCGKKPKEKRNKFEYKYEFETHVSFFSPSDTIISKQYPNTNTRTIHTNIETE